MSIAKLDIIVINGDSLTHQQKFELKEAYYKWFMADQISKTFYKVRSIHTGKDITEEARKKDKEKADEAWNEYKKLGKKLGGASCKHQTYFVCYQQKSFRMVRIL